MARRNDSCKNALTDKIESSTISATMERVEAFLRIIVVVVVLRDDDVNEKACMTMTACELGHSRFFTFG